MICLNLSNGFGAPQHARHYVHWARDGGASLAAINLCSTHPKWPCIRIFDISTREQFFLGWQNMRSKWVLFCGYDCMSIAMFRQTMLSLVRHELLECSYESTKSTSALLIRGYKGANPFACSLCDVFPPAPELRRNSYFSEKNESNLTFRELCVSLSVDRSRILHFIAEFAFD